MDNEISPVPTFRSDEDVARFNTAEQCYVIIAGVVYDLSDNILEEDEITVEQCGKDITDLIDPVYFVPKYVDNFVGYMENFDEYEFGTTLSDSFEEQEQEVFIDEVDNGSSLTIDDVALYASLFILILLLASFVFVFFQWKKQDEIVQEKPDSNLENKSASVKKETKQNK